MKTGGWMLAAFLFAGTALAVGQSGMQPQAATSGNEACAAQRADVSSGTMQQSQATNPAPNSQSAAPASSDSGNAALQSRINDALRNEPTLGASHVTAAVSDTGIDLSGTVGSTKDKTTAERIASSFDGNRKLTDNIAVTGAGHSDLAPNHPAMNNGGVGNVQNPATNSNTSNPQR